MPDDEGVADRKGGMGKTTRRRGAAKLAGPTQPSARPSARRGFRAVGVAVSKLTVPIVARRGGGILVRLKAEWAAIVGPDWAEVTWPTALGRDGVLKLRAAPGAALELQHRAPLIIERINCFSAVPSSPAWRSCKGHCRSRRGAGQARASDRCRKARRRRSTSGSPAIADPDLRAALARLGRAVRREAER